MLIMNMMEEEEVESRKSMIRLDGLYFDFYRLI